jgi:hypothetical protein
MDVVILYICLSIYSFCLLRSTEKVFAARGASHPYQRSHVAGEHITALICLRADGKVLPPMIIYKTTLPKTAYKEMGPPGALYRATPSGFINATLCMEYITYLDTLIPGMTKMKICINDWCLFIHSETSSFCFMLKYLFNL